MKLFDLTRSVNPTPLGASVGCLAVLASAVASIAFAPTAAEAISAEITSVSCTGTSVCVTGKNAANGIGVFGQSVSGTGVHGNSTSSYGLFGTSKSGVGLKATSSSGLGILGTSSSANGIIGDTSALSSLHAGVTGADLANSGGINDGVLGTTTNGGWGVQGTSTNGAFGGVNGVGTTGTGVRGISASSVGVGGFSTSSTGVGGVSSTGDGIDGTTTSGTGVYADSNSGLGVYAFSNSNVALHALSSSSNGSDIQGSYIGIIGRSNTFPFVLTDTSANDLFYVDGSGNVYTHGTYRTFSATHAGQGATAFTTRSTTPNVEDVGAAQLVGGVATVRFDSAFAASIDRLASYHVFLTPGGDTRGLYVAAKTAVGFVVRETQGGRGTLAFDYRIVATAPGQAGQRMALVDTTALAPKAPIVRYVRPAVHETTKTAR